MQIKKKNKYKKIFRLSKKEKKNEIKEGMKEINKLFN